MVDTLPSPKGDKESKVEGQTPDLDAIAAVLDSYRVEAKEARESGPTPRDDVWRANWDRYWGRYDFSKKADWQAKFVMPETPQFVDRWAAAMREALTTGGRWYQAIDETGQSNELSPHVERYMDVLLARSARTPDGHLADFSSVFEDQMKLGALMMLCASVNWEGTPDGPWVVVNSVDPREYFMDPQMRGLYRLRRYEIDKHRLIEMAQQADGSGSPLYNIDVIMELNAQVDEDQRVERERSSGTAQGKEGHGARTPIVIDEWLADIILPGEDAPIAQNALVVVANERFIIRGPEENPFWHQRDWIVTTPMVTVPMSPYGRTYAEDWADPADAFVELTNLIMDGIFTTTMNAYAMQGDALKDPGQVDEGIWPNKIFDLEDGVSPRDFMKDIDLGTLPGEAITVWRALKQEMREGAKLSEIALGQVPPKGDITATEVNEVSQSGSAMIRSMARTIEQRFLEPLLTLVFQTALQHMDFNDERLQRELGAETAQMLGARKEEFRGRQIKFRVRALSSIVDRQVKLQNMLAMLQTFAQSEPLMQAFLEKHDVSRLADTLLELFGVDPLDFQISQRERAVRQIMQQVQGAAGQGQEGAPAPGGQAVG